MTVKIEHFVAGQPLPFRHANTFAREQTSGSERVRIGPRDGHRALVCALAAELTPPYRVLYVLHTSRTDARLGRYESPILDAPALLGFFARFGAFLAGDARHDVWVLGDGEGEFVIWDRHDLVYAYGPIGRYVEVLEEGGLREGWPSWPVPHVHHYRAEWDAAERQMLAAFDWDYSQLRPSDVQYVPPPE